MSENSPLSGYIVMSDVIRLSEFISPDFSDCPDLSECPNLSDCPNLSNCPGLPVSGMTRLYGMSGFVTVCALSVTLVTCPGDRMG